MKRGAAFALATASAPLIARAAGPLYVRPPADALTEIRGSQEGAGGAAATPGTDVVMTPSVAI